MSEYQLRRRDSMGDCLGPSDPGDDKKHSTLHELSDCLG